MEKGLRDYGEDEMRDMLTFANAGASIITTRRGRTQSDARERRNP